MDTTTTTFALGVLASLMAMLIGFYVKIFNVYRKIDHTYDLSDYCGDYKLYHLTAKGTLIYASFTLNKVRRFWNSFLVGQLTSEKYNYICKFKIIDGVCYLSCDAITHGEKMLFMFKPALLPKEYVVRYALGSYITGTQTPASSKVLISKSIALPEPLPENLIGKLDLVLLYAGDDEGLEEFTRK